ncbi:MAG TPA: ABC transporter substrate-binding protein [Gammaproteobacteria bacterium]|nr:ABC transporter substrate-binding protein [Gammaproteobacteria bacterium]
MARWMALCMMLLVAGPAAADQKPTPESAASMIKSTADQVMKAINADKARYRQHHDQLYQLVDDKVLPHVDAAYMTQLAVGRYWRRADHSQKQQITDAFTRLLVRTYATSLLEYSGDNIHWLPVHARDRDQDVTLRAQVHTSGGPPVPMIYRLHLQGGDWRVYDVVVDGVSLVTTYRSSFDDLISQKGMDGFIAALQKKAQEAGPKAGS